MNFISLAFSALQVCFGAELSPSVQERIWHYLRSVRSDINDCSQAPTLDSTVLAFGNHALSDGLLGPTVIEGEGMELRQKERDSIRYLIARGGSRLGSHYAAYELLEGLGFSFFHPLAPTKPRELHFPNNLDRTEQAYWPARRWHLHTQHPLELTDLLNGFGPELPDWENFLEWCLANKQNQISWYLLMAKDWQEYADSAARQARLKKLVAIAQDYGFKVGLTAPLAFKQQHAWTMIRRSGEEKAQIRAAIDWLSKLGIDFIEIEMGFSEFTHPDDQTMLDWMNEATSYAKARYQIQTSVKVHASTGQLATNFRNPETGEALNFNFLPYYADRDLAVMPHTVQHYGLFDPAPTYGNQNFRAIFDYMRWEAGRREVLFYPETAYWVSFDVDVPLFLPLYAERRLSDLKRIAIAERSGELGLGEYRGSRIQGQVNFSSGWEWGYWLHELITARAAWNPDPDISEALRPVTSRMGAAAPQFEGLLLDIIQFEKETLIEGRIDGKEPASIGKRSGQAYLQGVDAWDDIAELIGRGNTQPSKLGLVSMRHPWAAKGLDFERDVNPLLKHMKQRFADFQERMKALEPLIPQEARWIFAEFSDALEMTSLRATQVFALYNYVAEDMRHGALKNLYRDQAKAARQSAYAVVARREASYRAPLGRIASWKTGPTAYPYQYLWTVHSLYYWWRDEAKALQIPRSPCFGNILDPLDVAFGQGIPFQEIWGDCLNKPKAEPLLK